MLIHSPQHLHGTVTSLATPDLPGELPPALREATAHIWKVGLGVSQHPTSPSCHLLPAPGGDREEGACPIPTRGTREDGSRSAEPARSIAASTAGLEILKSSSLELPEDEQADGLGAGVRLESCRPLSSAGGSSPARDSSWQARRKILPCLPGCASKAWSNPPAVFQKRHANFCGEGSAESR